ncbi:Ig-like domain-containing protein [Luteimicrobium subarcticum]|uniref:Ig-like domain-containing protein n=1 Tax=Luteimicrobium subarcticum TaxID=620910 RepID=A0A2M8WT68_9MICO|nr:Ig-like domain-containing protein [Luteimicrobium subarcticum]
MSPRSASRRITTRTHVVASARHVRNTYRRQSRVARRLIAAGATLLTLGALLPILPAAASDDPCGPSSNAIVCENSKPGTPEDQWDISGAGDSSIQGFADQVSVQDGDTINFKVDTDASAYSITIFRTGYYGGDGARKIATVQPSATLPQEQPACLWDQTTELTDCGDWSVSASWKVPADAVSGVYVARLQRTDTGGASHIIFDVRDNSSHADIVVQTSDTTWQAYNSYGGSDFYEGAANGRAYKISYNRPIITRGTVEDRSFYFSAEYPMVRFLEQNGYDVTYQSDVDTDRYGSLLTNHKVFLSSGHDEYWSGQQRKNVEAARDAGVNLAFFSGNQTYWRTRYEPGSDYRTLVSYKETWSYGKIDPANEWTGTYRDPEYAPQSEGAGIPENALAGTLYVSDVTDLPVTVSATEGKQRFWRGTGLDTMTAGQSVTLAPHTIGYESNEDQDNGFRPDGIIHLSTTEGDLTHYIQDFGMVTGLGHTVHNTTLYKAPSGALVFSTGSIQWAWGLDADHDGATAPADPRMRQATVNIFADMGAQPVTIASGLVRATGSTDTTGPTVTITSPTTGKNIANGTVVTATGTATDSGGGVVAGVEASTDGGKTWHPASGGAAWTYTYTQSGSSTASLRVRAVDDSANIGAAASVSLQTSCPCSVYGDVTPPDVDNSDNSALELGLRFTPDSDGYVTGVRFYKSRFNLGTHVGSLWSSDGQLIARATFADESDTGWQTVAFSSPAAVTAGTSYVVSYSDPRGQYSSKTWEYSLVGRDAPPLSVKGGYGAAKAGTFGSIGTFPAQSYNDSTYYVDPVFELSDASPVTVTDQWPVADSTSAGTGSTVTATFSKPVDASTVSVAVSDSAGNAVAGSTSYAAASRIATFTPSSALTPGVTYTVAVKATSVDGTTLTTGRTWSFTTAKPDSSGADCPCSLFTPDTVPDVVEDPDRGPVVLGVELSPTQDGTITGVKFYKGPDNTGTHVGSFYAADGSLLASATFTDESSSGWQTVTFATPVPVRAGERYVAAYSAPRGMYSVTVGGLASATSAPPLVTRASAGRYTYGSGMPDTSSTANYFVDVVFQRPLAAQVVSTTPGSDAYDVAAGTTVAATASEPLAGGTELTVVDAAGGTVAGTSSLSSDALTVAFVPAARLAAGATYTASLHGAKTVDGVVVPDVTWSFTVKAAASAGDCPCSLFAAAVPDVAGVGDDHSTVELGTRFTPQVDGWVSAIRFYKGPGNGGTHVGTLWTSDGTKLASVTFTDETETGWQTAALDEPVKVTAGTTYVASYLAPQGGYAATSGYFSAARTVGPLTAPGGENGVYVYGGGFPQYSWSSTSYFVDVVFDDDPAPSLTSMTPAAGAAGVSTSSTVTAVLSAAPVGATPALALSSASGGVDGVSTFETSSRTVTFTPAGELSPATKYTAKVTTEDGTVVGSWTFTTAAAVVTGPQSLWATTDEPASASWPDNGPVQVGVRVTVGSAGTVTGVRFYKGLGNGGAHVGYVWSASGARLGSGTIANETAMGWQTITLDTPVHVTAGTSLVISYYAPQGHYGVTVGGLAQPRSQGDLTTSATGGAYTYGTGFPDGTSAANYWVDLVFEKE